MRGSVKRNHKLFFNCCVNTSVNHQLPGISKTVILPSSLPLTPFSCAAAATAAALSSLLLLSSLMYFLTPSQPKCFLMSAKGSSLAYDEYQHLNFPPKKFRLQI